MREELWRGLAERMGMDVREVEEKCLGWGLGRLRVGSRLGGRRRGAIGRGEGGRQVVGGGGLGGGGGVAAGSGLGGVSVSTVMPGPMMNMGQGQELGAGQGQAAGGRRGMGQGQGQHQRQGQGQGLGQGDGEEGRNYTHSPVPIGSSGTEQSPIQPGPTPGAGMMGPGMMPGIGTGMLPLQSAPPLTTLVPIPPTTAHGYTPALPTSSAPGMSTGIPPPPLPLMQQHQQQQPRVAFGGYLNGRSTSTSRRQQSMSSTSTSPTAHVPPTMPNTAGQSSGYIQPNAQWQQQHVITQEGGGSLRPTGTGDFGHGYGQGQVYGQAGAAMETSMAGVSSWGNDGTYPPSSFG